jgi:hypothetical protein
LEKKTKVKEILLKALKGMFRIMLYVFIFLLAIAALLQVPTVQTYLAGHLTANISEKTGYKSSIGAIRIRWWDAISLRDVEIYDLNDSLMMDLEEVYIDFSINGLLDKERPGLDEINLRNGYVGLLTHNDDLGINITVFLDRLKKLFGQRQKTSSGTTFNIANISFEKTAVDIIDYSLPDMDLKFDYANLQFRDLVANADDFYIKNDTVAFDLKYMKGSEANSGMVFQQLRTNFTYSSVGMEFKGLLLKSNETEIKNYLRFDYEDISALRDFNREVDILAQLDEAVLDIRDLGYFSDNVPPIDDRIYLSGKIIGKINSLFSEELLLRFGERSALFGKFDIEGLPLVDETYFNLSLINSIISSEDLIPYVNPGTQRELDKLGTVRFDSDFTGYLDKFNANGDFRTNVGILRGNLNYIMEGQTPIYQGQIETIGLDVGILMEDRENFQKVNLNGQIKGSGLTAASALIELDANIDLIGINGYDYSNIKTNATYGKDLFKGRLTVNDPNLVIEVDGTLDLRDNKDSANLFMKLDTAFLQHINLMEEDVFLSGSFDLDTKGIHWDNIEGVTRFSDVLVSYEGRDLFIDNFIFQSLFTDDSRVISLNSDLLVAGISGNFKVKQLAADVRRLWEDYYAILTNEFTTPQNDLQKEEAPYQIDINLDFRNPNPILNLLDPKLFISNNTLIEGAFYQTAENTVFNFFSSIDTVYLRWELFSGKQH